MSFEREPQNVDITVAATLGAAKAVSFGDYSAGILMIPADAAASGTLNFYVSTEEEGTFLPLWASDGTALIAVTGDQGTARELPVSIFAADWVKILTSVATGNNNWMILAKT